MKKVLHIAAILIALFGVGFGIGCLISLISPKKSKGEPMSASRCVTISKSVTPRE